jgi:hypothetical protein
MDIERLNRPLAHWIVWAEAGCPGFAVVGAARPGSKKGNDHGVHIFRWFNSSNWFFCNFVLANQCSQEETQRFAE